MAYPAPSGPASGLTLGTDGFFYGSTTTGGAHRLGTVFKLSDIGVFSDLWDFGNKVDDQGSPEAPLVLGADGNLYGTNDGGYNGQYGSVSQDHPEKAPHTIHAFKATDGTTPYGMILGLDGNFYGVTRAGGAHNLGVVFKMTKAGKVTVLWSFAGYPGDGSQPVGGLVQGNDGVIYGTTYAGGSLNQGTMFKISSTGSGYLVLHNFDYTKTVNDGLQPLGDLALGTDGNVYGTTVEGRKTECRSALQDDSVRAVLDSLQFLLRIRMQGWLLPANGHDPAHQWQILWGDRVRRGNREWRGVL